MYAPRTDAGSAVFHTLDDGRRQIMALRAPGGEMTLLGITKPMPLTITHFKCIIHPLLKREVCGADAHGRFDRSDYGMNIGLPRFSPEIKLAIQVEAIKAD